MKASTTVWPPFVITGLLIVWVITSTRIPGSMRMPLEFFTCLVVIMNRAIILTCLRLPTSPGGQRLTHGYEKVRGSIPSSPRIGRYRQTPKFTAEEGRKNARTVMYILWTYVMSSVIQNRGVLVPRTFSELLDCFLAILSYHIG